MSLNDPSIKEVALTLFKGSDNTSDAYNVDPAHLINAQNLDFTVAENGMVQAGTRTGTTSFAGGTFNKIVSMASWVFVSAGVQTGWLVFFDLNSNDVFAWKQNSSTFTSILLSSFGSTIAANFAFEGARMYVAFQNNVIAGPGDNAAKVYGFTTAVGDNLFLPGLATPGTATVTFGASGAGVITAGTHRVGFIYTTNNGYTSVLNPVIGSGATPNQWSFSQITTTSNLNIVVQINYIVNPITNVIASGGTVQVVMTPASNPNKVFTVPGATAVIPNAITTTTITISISDADLIATGTDVTQNQNLLATNPQSGAAPFKPSAIFQYSARMGYCTYDASGFPVVYFSDQNAYQSLTAAFHGVYIEGRQIPIQGASLGGVCYIATLSGLYATQDNGGLPSTWIPPARVDGSVGILSASCMSASTQVQGTATGRIILASEKGLFVFKGGTFPEIPLSYWQTTDWNRINWLAPWQLQIVDDVYRQKIRVLAPLKSTIVGATNAGPIVVTTAQPHLLPAATGSQIVQIGTTGVSASGNTSATTAAINTTGATLLVITVCGNAAIGTAAVSDSFGNSWHARADATVSGIHTGIWYSFDKSGSPLATGAGHTVTVTLSTVGIVFSSFIGTLANHVDPYDSTAGESTGTNASGTTVQPGSITAINGSLVVTSFGYGNGQNASSISAPYAFASIAAVPATSEGCAMGFANNVTTTNPTWTANGTTILVATIASFKAQPVNLSQIPVTITGASGNTAANVTATPIVLSPTTFSIPVAGNGAYTFGGIVTPASANAELDWTYPEGDEPGQPYYSLNSWASYAPGSIAIVRNLTTQIDETWYGPFGTSTSVFQRRVVAPTQDPLQFRDQDLQGNPVPIPAMLETSLLPNSADIQRTLHDYHGAHFRVSGSGQLSVTAFSLDHTLSVVPAASPFTLNLTPGQEILMRWFLRNEQQSIQLSTNAVDAFFVISRIKAYYTDSLPIR